MQDANAYLDQILSEAGARVSTDSAPDAPSDIQKGGLPCVLCMTPATVHVQLTLACRLLLLL